MTTSYTITCSRPTNYGAVLQTYGLNTALRKMGVDAKVLDYNQVLLHIHTAIAYSYGPCRRAFPRLDQGAQGIR